MTWTQRLQLWAAFQIVIVFFYLYSDIDLCSTFNQHIVIRLSVFNSFHEIVFYFLCFSRVFFILHNDFTLSHLAQIESYVGKLIEIEHTRTYTTEMMLCCFFLHAMSTDFSTAKLNYRRKKNSIHFDHLP